MEVTVRMLRRRWPFVIVGVLVLVGCVATTALANGSAALGDAGTWTMLNAIVNATSLVGGLITAAVAWVVRSINSKMKRLTDCMEAYVEWQREHYEATRANMMLLATKQNGHEVACVGEHGPMPGRAAVPEIPMFEWPAPPQRRSTDRH